MNCDQVFDILTRGPFPTGSACDIPVEAHLEVCPECRRLAEALRPALELFQETVAPEESRDLPGYWCAVAADRQHPRVSYADEPELPRHMPRVWTQPQPSSQFTALTLWRMAAMLALGATLGLLVSSRGAWDLSKLPPGLGGAAATAAGDDEVRAPGIAPPRNAKFEGLPLACWDHKQPAAARFTWRGEQLLAKVEPQKMQCCTGCHNAGSDRVPGAATLTVAQQCQVCHDGSRPAGQVHN